MYGRRAPEAAGGVDELPFAQGQGLPAHDPADVGPVEETDDEDQQHDPQRVALQAERVVGDDTGQRDREDQQREGQEDVHQAG